MDNNSFEQKNGELTPKGLEDLMLQFSNEIFLFVRGMVNSNELAEEIVSDVFVKIWNKRKQFAAINNLKSFLFISARNESISAIRKNKKLKTVSIEDLGEYFPIPLESDGSEKFNEEIVAKINKSIDALPAKCKMAFSLAKINGLKYKEIAEIMEISPSTVKNHIATALEKVCKDVGVLKNGDAINQSDIYLLILHNKNKKKSKL